MDLHPAHDLQRVHMRALGRLHQLHVEISSGRCPSIQDLAVSTGYTSRTIKRDVKALREAFHAPLVYDRQRKGLRYAEPGWQLPPARFSEGELLAFFTAHHVLHALVQTPEATLLQNALAKLAALLPEQVTFNPNMIRTALTFETTPHVMVEPYLLQTLTRAALEQRTLSVQYYSQHRNALTERQIDVLHLHNFTGDWYAIAFDHRSQEVRDFHVGRIRHVQETEAFFMPPPDWSAEAHLRRGFSMMRGGRLTTVSLVFDAYQARWMRERQTFHVDEHREDLPDGGLRLSFPVGRNGLDAVARFCLTYAGHCRAEKPAALRQLIRERLLYKKLHGYDRRLQYSIFRCRLTVRQMERLHWELEALLTPEDRLLILRLCDSCERHVATHNRPEAWQVEARSFEIV